MNKDDIFQTILNGLNICTDEEGEQLFYHFTAFTLKEMANTITNLFPDTLEVKLTNLEIEVFDNLPDKETWVNNSFKTALAVVYKYLNAGSISKEEIIKNLHLVFFLSGRILFKRYNISIDSLYSIMIDFYNSFKINYIDLLSELKNTVETNAITKEINKEEYIRLLDNNFIPTTKTRKIFKYLL